MKRYPLTSPYVKHVAKTDIGPFLRNPWILWSHPKFRRKSGPHWLAIQIFAALIEWYRPVWVEEITEDGEVRVRVYQRFPGRMFQIKYRAWARWLFGDENRTRPIRDAVAFLRKQGLVVFYLHPRQGPDGEFTGNDPYIAPKPSALEEIFALEQYAEPPDDLFVAEEDADVSASEGKDEDDLSESIAPSPEISGDGPSHEKTQDGPSYEKSGDGSYVDFLVSPSPEIPSPSPEISLPSHEIPGDSTKNPYNKESTQQRINPTRPPLKAAAPLSGGGVSHDNFDDDPHESPPPGPKAPSSPKGTTERNFPAQVISRSGREGPRAVASDGISDSSAGGGNDPASGNNPSGASMQPRPSEGLPDAKARSGTSRDAPPAQDRRRPDPVPATAGRLPKGASDPRTAAATDTSSPDGPGRDRGGRQDAPERVLRDLGVPKKYRRRLAAALRRGEITTEDLAAELARCYRDAAKGRVERPVVAAVASLLADNRAPREFYDPSVWAEHLPEPVWDVLARAGWIPEDATEDVREADAEDEDPFAVLSEMAWKTWAEKPETPEAESNPPPSGEAEKLWKAVLKQFQREMSPSSFNTWLRPCRAVAFDGRTLTIAAPNMYAREWLESRLTNGLKRKLVGLLGRHVDVRFVVKTEIAGGEPA